MGIDLKFMRLSPWVILALVLMFESVPVHGNPAHVLQVRGRVTSAADGEPLSYARVLIWSIEILQVPILEVEEITDADGFFALTVETNRPKCTVYVFYDDPSTEGFDTIPAAEDIDTSTELHRLDFNLMPASTVLLEGPLRLVDSASNINDYICEVLDSKSEKLIRFGSFNLVYGTGRFGQSYYLRLDPDVIIVPAETPFELKLTPSYLVETTTVRRWPWRRYLRRTGAGHRELYIREEEGFVLSRGEMLILDIRQFSIASDIAIVERSIETLERSLKTKEEQGFYTVSERHDLAQMRGLMDGAAATLSMGLFEDAYIAARQAYISARNLQSRLLSMELEASTSLKELVVFVAFTSVAFSYLFLEQRRRRIVFSSILYALLLLYLYLVYPGSSVISPVSLVAVSAVSLLAIFLIISLLPRLAWKPKIEEGLPFIASLESLFSMAKRSLLRRRLRFILTLLSILILSMSFVALTSVSTGYGLISSPQEWAKSGGRGIVVKQLKYTPSIPLMKGWFHEVTQDIADWIEGREGVVTVARKAESYPRLKNYGFIGEQPIAGIIGIEPSVEPTLPDIKACIVEGDFPLEGGDAVLVSKGTLNELGGAIGDAITIGDVQLRITGTFNLQIMDVRDLNGELMAPNMMIDLTPGSGPTIVVQPCDYEAFIITSFDRALEIDKDIHVSRIAATLEEGIDLIKLAKSIALERGVRVWASTGSEVFAAHVGEYFVGKGLPILVPWIIVILNVFMTMLNAMYERRGEMSILSSVGLNPSHIAGMFVAEASMTGIVGGGFGYLIGLGLYPLMFLLSSAPVVHQKISAIWSLGSIGIAAAAAAVGVIVAIKGSVVLTPSLEMRWALAGSPRTHLEPWIIPIPAKIEDDELEEFMNFMKRSLMAHRDRSSYPNITSIREERRGEEALRAISFWYREGDTGLGGSSASCTLQVHDREGKSYYTTELHSFGAEKDIRRAGNFIRALVIKWKTEREK